jgi:hypothetical protein
MTDDLVKRLRYEIIGRPDCIAPNYVCVHGDCPCDENDRLRAADRIDQLEAALHLIGKKDAELEDIAIWIDDDTPLGQFIDRVLQNPQSAALGEKKDG